MARTPQTCHWAGCTNTAAYPTRTRATYCDSHITQILAEIGMVPLEPFEHPTTHRLCSCTRCGVETHLMLNSALDYHPTHAACRACHWREWAADARRRSGAEDALEDVTAVREAAEAAVWEFLHPLTAPPRRDDPFLVRCTRCGRREARRAGDIGSGCPCSRGGSSVTARKPARGSTCKPATNLLKVSGLPAVKWWDHEANTGPQWETTVVGGMGERHWCCPDYDHRFTARPHDMTSLKPSCPECQKRDRDEWSKRYERMKRTAVADIPELLEAWADTADPATVMVAGGSMAMFKFVCPAGHRPRLHPLTYLDGGCPFCAGARTRAANEKAGVRLDEEMAAQWDAERNTDLDVTAIGPKSRRQVWWRDPVCGYRWQDSPLERQRPPRRRCPACGGILGSLGWWSPELAAQWSPENPETAWDVRPHARALPYTPWWVCPAGHRWQAPVTSRAGGGDCPECRTVGKSAIELAHHEAAQAWFGAASSGRVVQHQAFTNGGRWTLDIAVDLSGGRTLAIEYDGAYWHGSKSELDTAKSRDLLAAGMLVVRIREHPLLGLPITATAYLEVVAYADVPDPEGAIQNIAAWVAAQASL